MRKKLFVISGLIWLFFFVVLTPYHAQAGGGEIGVVLDGTKLEFDVAPVIVNDRTLVPMRTIFEALGYNITWQEADQTVVAVKDGNTLSLQIDSTTAMLNNQPVQLDVAPQIINDRTLVPLRFIGESSNCDVLWDDKTETVFIEYRISDYEACQQIQYKNMVTNGQWLFYSGFNGTYQLESGSPQARMIYDSFKIIQADIKFLYGYDEEDECYYKVDLMNLNTEKILDHEVYYFKVLGGVVYYQDGLSIYKMSLTGNEITKIVDVQNQSTPYVIIGDNIYYATYDDESYSSMLIKKSILGNESKVIYNNWVSNMTVYNDELYYSGVVYKDGVTPIVYNGIFKYDPKNDTTIKISDGHAENIFVLGKNLYYQVLDDQSQKCKLYREKLDDSYIIKLADDVIVDNIIGNGIYFLAANAEGGLSYYRMNTDGSNRKEVVDYYHLPESERINII